MQNHEMRRLFSNKVNKWTPTWRYTSMQATREEATEFIDSVDTVMRWVFCRSQSVQLRNLVIYHVNSLRSLCARTETSRGGFINGV